MPTVQRAHRKANIKLTNNDSKIQLGGKSRKFKHHHRILANTQHPWPKRYHKFYGFDQAELHKKTEALVCAVRTSLSRSQSMGTRLYMDFVCGAQQCLKSKWNVSMFLCFWVNFINFIATAAAAPLTAYVLRMTRRFGWFIPVFPCLELLQGRHRPVQEPWQSFGMISWGSQSNSYIKYRWFILLTKKGFWKTSLGLNFPFKFQGSQVGFFEVRNPI